MHLEFVYGGVERSVNTILEFTDDDTNSFWSEPLFRFYPDMDRNKYSGLDRAGRKAFLTEYFTGYASAHSVMLAEKLALYNSHWQKYEPQIISALEDAFGISLDGCFDDMVCHTTFCPISPRYLELHAFDNFFLESEKGALGTAIHEIIHFIWFHVWQVHFRDPAAEYETPHLKWILSEMVVEPIMRDRRLADINPYFQHNACVYPYFYTLRLNGEPVLDILHRLYTAMPMVRFMEEAMALCQKHEAEIRAHIHAAENP